MITKKQQLLLTAACICGFAMSSHAQLDPSLVAWYQFDEGAGATIAANAVAGSSTGAVGINVTTGVAGISGNAYSFTGNAGQNDIVDMGNASFFSSINLSGQLTFSAWIKTTDTTGNRNTVVFAGDDTKSNAYSDLGVAAGQAGHEGEATARNRPAVQDGDQATGIYSTGVTVNDGDWHNIVMTVDLSSFSLLLYVDGNLTNSQTMTDSVFPSFNNFEVGRLGRSSPTDGYLGVIDDVQVYDTALSGDQISWLFNNPGEALTAVPEPSQVSVAVVAGLGLLAGLRRKRRRTAPNP